MSIQVTAAGSDSQKSEIHIFDIRNGLTDEPFVLLGVVERIHDGIFLVSMNTDDDGSNSLIGLYRLDVNPTKAICTFLTNTLTPSPV